MFYEFSVTAPKNTPIASPVKLDVALVPGMISRVAVQFPSGCVGLVGATVYHKLHQVWPTNPDGFIIADDFTVQWEEQYEVNEDPFKLQLRVYNLDDTFPHTVTFRFAELGGPELKALRDAQQGLDYLGRWFARQRLI